MFMLETYDIVTPESVEDGGAAERGWVHPGGWHHGDPPEPEKVLPGDLRHWMDTHGCDEISVWRQGDGDVRARMYGIPSVDYRTGEWETRCLHLEGIPRRCDLVKLKRVLEAL